MTPTRTGRCVTSRRSCTRTVVRSGPWTPRWSKHSRTRNNQRGKDEGNPFYPAGKVTVNFAVVIAVFPIIFLGELPDKTMFASLVLSTRGKPFSVWLGAAGAFVVHVVIAVTIGVALF